MGNIENNLPVVEKTKSFAMIRTLVVVSFLSGILIVSAFQMTLSKIKENKANYLRKAVFEVLPGAIKSVTYKVNSDGSLVLLQGEDEKAKKFYAGYTQAGELVGIAIEANKQGFQDIIRVIYGYSPSGQKIIGMKVLESKETPGLGDKIEKDPDFKSNFSDLDVTLTSDGKGLLHEIEIVKKGKKTQKWQIDTITGATISSKAVGKMMKESTTGEIPLIYKNLEIVEKNNNE